MMSDSEAQSESEDAVGGAEVPTPSTAGSAVKCATSSSGRGNCSGSSGSGWGSSSNSSSKVRNSHRSSRSICRNISSSVPAATFSANQPLAPTGSACVVCGAAYRTPVGLTAGKSRAGGVPRARVEASSGPAGANEGGCCSYSCLKEWSLRTSGKSIRRCPALPLCFFAESYLSVPLPFLCLHLAPSFPVSRFAVPTHVHPSCCSHPIRLALLTQTCPPTPTSLLLPHSLSLCFLPAVFMLSHGIAHMRPPLLLFIAHSSQVSSVHVTLTVFLPLLLFPRQLFEIEGGVCQLCNLDAHRFFKQVRGGGGGHWIGALSKYCPT